MVGGRATTSTSRLTGDGRAAVAVLALWAAHALALYFWLQANLFQTGWDRPKHLVTSLIFNQTLQPVSVTSLFQVFSLNLGYYPPLFPLSIVPLYRLFGVSPTTAGMVNALYMLVLMFSAYGIGRRLYDVRVGLLGAFLASMSPFLFCMAHYAYLDYALTAWIALSAYLLLATDGFRRAGNSVLFGVALGLGMLTKWTPVLFLAGPLVIVGWRGGVWRDAWTGLRGLRLPWREALAAIVAGAGFTWFWYAPSANLADSLFLGPWLPALSVLLTAAMVFCVLLPSRPSLNVLKSAGVSAWLTSLWYAPRADMFRDIASIVAGGRADRPNLLSLSAYLYYPGRLINEGFGWPLFLVLALLAIAALYRWWQRGRRLSIPWQHGYLLSWALVPLIVATLSTHREVRSVLPLLIPTVIGFAWLLLRLPHPGWRRAVASGVLAYSVLQFLVLTVSPLAPIALATHTALPWLDEAGLFALGEHIQWANLDEHDPGYFITPDVLRTISESEPPTAPTRPALGLLINGRSLNEYNVDYVVRTQFPSLRVENLTQNRNRLPGYAQLFSCDYLLMRDDIDGGEPSDLIQTVLKDPPSFFKDNFVLTKTYPLPHNGTAYLFRNQARTLPNRFGSQWLAPIQNVTEVNFGQELRLLGYKLDESRVAEDGQLLVTLYWMSLGAMREDYAMHLKLLNGVSHIFGEQKGRPLFDAGLTSKWYPWQVVEDIRAVPVFPGTPPGSYSVELSVQGIHEGKSLASDAGRLLLGPAQIAARRPPSLNELRMDQTLDANLDGQVRLLGYTLDSGRRPGDGVHLTLFWQALKPMSQNYTVFNHLVDATGKVWTQKDNPPVDGFYPTSTWSAGEIVRDRYDLVIPPDAPAGDYSIDVGIYSNDTGQRLPVIGPDGQATADHVLLTQLEVKRATQ